METTFQTSGRIAFQRWAGAAFILGNMLFLLNKLNEMSRHFLRRPMADIISGQDPLLILIGQTALIAGYLGYYRQYSRRCGRAGKAALRLFCGGGMLLAFAHIGFISALKRVIPPAAMPYVESLFILLLLGLALLIIGLVWFGALNLRRPVTAHARLLPLTTGLMGFIGFFLFSGEQITPVFLFFRTLFALGLIGMGLALALENPAPDGAEG